jgi:hypothetical protein
MSASLKILATLAGLAALVVLFCVLAFAVTWLVGLAFRFAPLVGRRHRVAPLVGREPIETESSKLGARRM